MVEPVETPRVSLVEPVETSRRVGRACRDPAPRWSSLSRPAPGVGRACRDPHRAGRACRDPRVRLVELVETPHRDDRCGFLAGRGGDEERGVWWRWVDGRATTFGGRSGTSWGGVLVMVAV